MKKTLKSVVLIAGISFVTVNANAQLASERAAVPAPVKGTSQNKAITLSEVQTASSAPASTTPAPVSAVRNTESAEKVKQISLISDPQQAPGTIPAPAAEVKTKPLSSDPQQVPGGR